MLYKRRFISATLRESLLSPPLSLGSRLATTSALLLQRMRMAQSLIDRLRAAVAVGPLLTASHHSTHNANFIIYFNIYLSP